MKKIVLALLLTGVLAGPALAQEMDMPMHEHHEGHGPKCNMKEHEHGAGPGQMMGRGMMGMGMANMDKMDEMMGMCLRHAGEMGLTPEQITKMKPAHMEMKKKQIRFLADLKIAELELMEIMEVKDFDLEKANAAVKKIAELKTAHHLEMLQKMKEMRALLTEEQFEKMKTMMMKMGHKPGPMRMKKK